jgi:hypothetical protein
MRATVTFVDNATTLLQLGNFTVLTDPAFGAAGSRVYLGYGAWTRRVKDPALQSTVPIHFDDYRVFTSPLSDYLTRARDQGLTGIEPITRGGTINLPLRIDRTDSTAF